MVVADYSHTLFYPALADAELKGKLDGSLLLLPTTNSVGFVGQLTVDLLISTYQLPVVGRLNSGLLHPFCGNEGKEGRLSHNIEVYSGIIDTNFKITVIQIRSPVFKTCLKEFSTRLATWIQSVNFKASIILTGVDASRRNDDELNRQSPIWTALCGAVEDPFSVSAAEVNIQQTHIPPTKPRSVSSYNPNDESTSASQHFLESPFPVGAGNARYILDALSPSDEKYLRLLCCFATEGDNTRNALEMAQTLLLLFKVKPCDLVIPTSWKGLFGNLSHTRELFR